MMKKAKFYLDSICPPIAGYDLGGHRNGWAKPAFDKESVIEILSQVHHYDNNFEWEYNERFDVFLTKGMTSGGSEGDDTNAYVGHTYYVGGVEGYKKLYTPGYCDWCWIKKEDV